MRTSKLRWALVAAVALGLASQTGAATTDNLQNLTTTGGSLTIGDKTFSNFNFLENGLTSFDASKIQVTASFAGGTYFLTWGGNMGLLTGSGSPVLADLKLNYRVTAATGMIDMIDQEFTGSVQAPGGGFLAIDETARDTNGNRVANSHLDANDMSDPSAEPGDNLNLNTPQQVIDLTKDIAFGIVNGGMISVSEIRQSFHQIIPEAGTTPMLVVGLAILGFVVRQKIRPKLPL